MLVVVAAAVAVGLVAAVRSLAAGGPDEDLRLVGGDSVVVQPGDTVWSIAVEVAGGDEDVRAVVDAIEEVNHLDGALVVPGEVLELP
ncbi:LysM peptidoglycan-binding domain-containing protein [Geodermatophilus sp. TF02-6]|uniref:LysM peptidoglycan-binding domain-containing protein n=1 Tax=Geodermatophilus sp. TF02-6 TaxID=2250575 RepID=UPI0013147120|nr:LysM peptidoglycan-binding domain-containing protein [Geodermatophilus sp. TF02-6]